MKGVEGLFGGGKKAPQSSKKAPPGADPLAPYIKSQTPPKTSVAKPDPLAPHIPSMQETEEQKRNIAISDYFMGPPKPIATEGSTPETNSGPDTIDIAKGILQAIPRDAASVGVSAGQAIANAISKKAGEAADVSIPTSKFGGKLGQIVLGNEPISGLADTAAKYESSIKNSAFAKKYGLDQHATTLAVLGATIPVSLDFLGAGGEESTIKALAAETDATRVAGILRNLGVHEDLIPRAAEIIAETSDKEAIANELKTIEATQKAVGTHASIEEKGGMTPEELRSLDESAAATERPIGEVIAESPAAKAVARETETSIQKNLPRSIEDISKALEDATQHSSFLKDTLIDHPGRGLMKYRSSQTGDLPELGAKSGPNRGVSKSKFAKSGDKIFQEMLGQDASGGGDVALAQEHLDEYLKIRDQSNEVAAYVKNLRQELKAAKAAEKEKLRSGRVQERTQKILAKMQERARASRARLIEVARNKPGSQTAGDFLRRGAVRADVRNARPITDLIQGKASEQMQKYAVDESKYGGIESGPFKGWSTRLKDWFQDWVFQRQAVPAEVKLVMSQFEVLKNSKMDWIYEYLGKGFKDGRIVEGTRSRYGMFGRVESQLNKWLDEEQAAGIKVADKDNYLPIYLKNAAAESEDAMIDDSGRRLGLRPGFSLQSQFKDYVEAQNAGYTPEFDSIYPILQRRAAAHFKAMADANMFRAGAREGWIVPKKAVADDLRGEFRDLSSDRFPAQNAAYGNTIYTGVWDAPASVAAKINNYLQDPTGFGKFLQKAGNVGAVLKNTALSVGIPGTGLSVHFWNVLPREIAIDFATSPLHAPFEVAKYFYYAANPRAAQRFIDANLKEAMPLIRAGMKFSTEDHSAARELTKMLDKEEPILGRAGAAAKATSDFLHKVFGGNTFGKLLPARKIANGLKLKSIYESKGMTADAAARAAADDINAVYGGINWEALGRDRNGQAMLRAAILAPDFAETNIKQGARIIKAFAKPGSIQSRIYRGMMYTYAAAYATANLINYENSGHWMYQNDILHQFSLDMGKDSNGKEKYLNIFGTGVEFLRIPLYVATSIAEGKLQDLNSVIRNRLSIPLASIFSLVENVDYKGDPIFGPTKFGQPQSLAQQGANVFSNTIGNALPGSAQNLGTYLQGKTPAAMTIMQALGLPITEKNINPTAADINALKAQAAANIRKGDYRLFNALVKAGAISVRSRARFVQTALRGVSARQKAAKAKAAAKSAKVKSNILNMGL